MHCLLREFKIYERQNAAISSLFKRLKAAVANMGLYLAQCSSVKLSVCIKSANVRQAMQCVQTFLFEMLDGGENRRLEVADRYSSDLEGSSEILASHEGHLDPNFGPKGRSQMQRLQIPGWQYAN